MEIQYLQKLRDNDIIDESENEGLSLTQISYLESLYNNNMPFPKVLRELLFLAGAYCGVIDFGIFDNQVALQSELRLKFLNIHNLIIMRPHYFVDLSNYDLPLFMFLDEGDNPELCQITQDITPAHYYRRIGGTLQDLINSSIQNHLDGYGAF